MTPLHITTYPRKINIGPCDEVIVRVRPESADLTCPAIGAIRVRALTDNELEVKALTATLNRSIKEVVFIDGQTFVIRYYPPRVATNKKESEL